MPLMVPVTLMPLLGAGAVAEGCQQLLGPSSSVAGDRHLLAALRHLRAEQRGYGTERQDKVISLASRTERTRELAFCQGAQVPAIYLRQLLAPLFRLVTAKPQKQTNASVAPSR